MSAEPVPAPIRFPSPFAARAQPSVVRPISQHLTIVRDYLSTEILSDEMIC